MVTYLPTCLLRRALSFAVQGLIMLSEGEMYCFDLLFIPSANIALTCAGQGGTTYSPCSILDCRTWRWYSMLLTSALPLASVKPCVEDSDELTSFAARTLLPDMMIALAVLFCGVGIVATVTKGRVMQM
jgi:hypothetical protein